MANTIQIKHGSSEPQNGILQPYELGYNINNNELYIGLPDGTAKKINEIQVIDRVANADNADKAKESGKASKDSKDQIITETYIKDIKIEGQTVTVTKGDNTFFTESTQDNNTTYDIATTEKEGLLSKEDKIKLDSIESEANKIIIDSSLSSTSLNPVQNKVIYEALQNGGSQGSGGMSLLYNSNSLPGFPGTKAGSIELSGTGYKVLAIFAASAEGSQLAMIPMNWSTTLYIYNTLDSTWCKRVFYLSEDKDQGVTLVEFDDCIGLNNSNKYNTLLQPIQIYKVM